MAETPSEVALLVDGSALFLASRHIDATRTLDYRALSSHLLAAVGAGSFSPAVFWTSFDPANEGQSKFLDFISTQLRWSVEAVPVQEAVAPSGPGQPNAMPMIRFGERIAYSIGRLSAKGHTSIVVLSDQFALCAPMLDVVTRGGLVWLAFFGGQLDPRFHRLVRAGVRDAAYEQGRASTYVDVLRPGHARAQPQGLRFIDIDDFADDIWGVARRATPGTTRGNGGFTRIP